MKPNYKLIAEMFRDECHNAEREKAYLLSREKQYVNTIANLREENNCLKQKYADAMDRIIALQEKLQKILEEQK